MSLYSAPRRRRPPFCGLSTAHPPNRNRSRRSVRHRVWRPSPTSPSTRPPCWVVRIRLRWNVRRRMARARQLPISTLFVFYVRHLHIVCLEYVESILKSTIGIYLLFNETPLPPAHIHFVAPPSMPTIYEQLADENAVALLEGGLLNLTCETQGGHPLATLSWYRGVEKVCMLWNEWRGMGRLYNFFEVFLFSSKVYF